MARTRHNGCTLAVASFIDRKGPSTVEQIVDGTGFTLPQVRDAVNCLVTRLGGAVLLSRRGNRRLYGKPGRDDLPASHALRENVAGRRYVPDSVPVLRRDPREHMRLALLGR